MKLKKFSLKKKRSFPSIFSFFLLFCVVRVDGGRRDLSYPILDYLRGSYEADLSGIFWGLIIGGIHGGALGGGYPLLSETVEFWFLSSSSSIFPFVVQLSIFVGSWISASFIVGWNRPGLNGNGGSRCLLVTRFLPVLPSIWVTSPIGRGGQ